MPKSYWKVFFHRDAAFLHLASVLSLGLALWLILRFPLGAASLWLIGSLLFFELIHWIPWYPGRDHSAGIRQHFARNRVVAVYWIGIGLGLKCSGFSEWALLPWVLGTLPMHYVAWILLYVHGTDLSAMPVNYFSHNLYLKEASHDSSRHPRT